MERYYVKDYSAKLFIGTRREMISLYRNLEKRGIALHHTGTDITGLVIADNNEKCALMIFYRNIVGGRYWYPQMLPVSEDGVDRLMLSGPKVH